MNSSDLNITSTKYFIGQVVHHKLFDYRGVIVDIDADFQLTDEWYDAVARSRPPKNEPWYHVLVHEVSNSTYVAEQNLEPDYSGKKIDHPMADKIFSEFQDGQYVNNERRN